MRALMALLCINIPVYTLSRLMLLRWSASQNSRGDLSENLVRVYSTVSFEQTCDMFYIDEEILYTIGCERSICLISTCSQLLLARFKKKKREKER